MRVYVVWRQLNTKKCIKNVIYLEWIWLPEYFIFHYITSILYIWGNYFLSFCSMFIFFITDFFWKKRTQGFFLGNNLDTIMNMSVVAVGIEWNVRQDRNRSHTTKFIPVQHASISHPGNMYLSWLQVMPLTCQPIRNKEHPHRNHRFPAARFQAPSMHRVAQGDP